MDEFEGEYVQEKNVVDNVELKILTPRFSKPNFGKFMDEFKTKYNQDETLSKNDKIKLIGSKINTINDNLLYIQNEVSIVDIINDDEIKSDHIIQNKQNVA